MGRWCSVFLGNSLFLGSDSLFVFRQRGYTVVNRSSKILTGGFDTVQKDGSKTKRKKGSSESLAEETMVQAKIGFSYNII